MLLSIHPENPDERKIRQVVELLERDAVIVVPTDTVYSFACALGSSSGLERIAQLKNIPLKEARFSIACADLSQLSLHARPLNSQVFKMMKKLLPGPFTFIVPANNNVPKWFVGKRKTIGIRVPDQKVIQSLLHQLGRPLVVSSVRDSDDIVEYTTDPELIWERHGGKVDAVIDSGNGQIQGSTVVDCSNDAPQLVRQGLGSVEGLV